MARFALGLAHYVRHDYQKANWQFKCISGKPIRYLYWLQAVVWYGLETKSDMEWPATDSLTYYCLRELKQPQGAYAQTLKTLLEWRSELGEIDHLFTLPVGNTRQPAIRVIDNLLTTPTAIQYLSNNRRYHTLLYERDERALLYAAMLVGDLLSVSWPGLLAALLITGLWFWFLWRLDMFERESIWPLLFCLGGGFLVANLGIFYHFYWITFISLEEGTSFMNNLLFYTFSVGLPEEATKILPVLLLLPFKRYINESYDYIL